VLQPQSTVVKRATRSQRERVLKVHTYQATRHALPA
jgi:hypothetical protein